MKKIVIPCIIALFSTACTTTNYLTEQEITSRYETVAQLQQAFTLAEASNLAILSPTAYEKAQGSLKEAMDLAKVGKEEANNIAAEGLAALDSANANATKAKDMLDNVLVARQKAEQQGAQNSLEDSFQKADQKLLMLTKSIEDGDFERVRESRMELAKTYRNLELKAMKQDIIESAERAIKQAEEMNADRKAPKTFNQAEEEMRLALNILEVNRSATDEAEQYAERARWWAERSMAVTEVVKTFEQGDYTEEDIVLWYQDQLTSVAAPITKELPLNYDNTRLLSSIRTDLEEVIAEKQQLAEQNQTLSSKSESLVSQGRAEKQELESRLTQTKEQAQEADRKFALIQSLFDEKEALVFKQQDDILLRTQGFNFPSGRSEIDSENFALLQKVIRAIDEYPTAKVTVMGHTDSVGDAQRNQELSQQRAQKVADFLVQVGQISSERVSARGHGESRPIASNDTKEGREENRRVEFMLQQ